METACPQAVLWLYDMASSQFFRVHSCDPWADSRKTQTKQKEMTPMKTVIKTSISRPPLRYNVILIVLVFAGFALSPVAQAVSPAPDGGYPGGNTAEGQGALLSLTTGTYNTAVGFLSLRGDTIGQLNTAIGTGALFANTADENTAVGAGALLSNTTGSQNTALGTFALISNAGFNNTATGIVALFLNTTGNFNTANGSAALSNNTIGNYNTAIGAEALSNNTTGDSNTATGYGALGRNTTATGNTAMGFHALFDNTTGQENTAIGSGALSANTTGSANTVLGANSGNGITTANGVICIGSFGGNVSQSCFVGNIRGVQTANPDAVPVLIDSAGQLGTASSSRRFKKEVKPMDKASEAILSLKPVTFSYKSDKTGIPQFGLIAEEVADVSPDLVVRDKKGEIYTVRYDAVNAMLLNEFLKEHKRVGQLEDTVASLAGTVKKQAAQLQKVSAQLVVKKPAPRVVSSP
jgi:hypothetical protein